MVKVYESKLVRSKSNLEENISNLPNTSNKFNLIRNPKRNLQSSISNLKPEDKSSRTSRRRIKDDFQINNGKFYFIKK